MQRGVISGLCGGVPAKAKCEASKRTDNASRRTSPAKQVRKEFNDWKLCLEARPGVKGSL